MGGKSKFTPLWGCIPINWNSPFGPRGKIAVFATSLRIKDDAMNKGEIKVASRVSAMIDGKEQRALSGVISDAHNFFKLLKSSESDCPYDLTNIWLQDGNDQGKNDMVQKIDRMFKEVEQDVFVIYYTGHGSETGDWIVPQELQSGLQIIESVSLDELLTIWEHWQSKDAQLIIIADSCHSGSWVKQINERDPDKIRVSMISSCGDVELCSESSNGGDFFDNHKTKQKNFMFNPTYTKDVFNYSHSAKL